MAKAGVLDKRVMFRRRAEATDTRGNQRGPFADLFKRWAGFRMVSAQERVEAGLAEDVEMGILTIRDGPVSRTITIADAVLIDSRIYQITAVGLPDRRRGTIAINVERKRA